MKRIIVQARELSGKLDRMKTVFRADKNLDISGGVKMSLHGTTLELSSVSDGMCAIERIYDASGDDGMEIVLDAGELLSFVKKRRSGEVEICVENPTVATITFPGGEMDLPTKSVNAFPRVFDSPEGDGLRVRTRDMVSVIGEACKYVRDDLDYKAMCDVLVEMDNMNMNIVATDSARMYVCKTPVERDGGLVSTRVSVRMAKMLDSHMTRDEETMVIRTDDRRNYFNTVDADLYETKRDHPFAPWRRIDEAYRPTTSVTIDRDTLRSAFDDAGFANGNGVANVRLSGEIMRIKCEDTIRGRRGERKVVAASKTGDDFDINVNAAYCIGAIDDIKRDDIVMEYDARMRAVRFMSGDNKGKYILVMCFQQV